MLRISRPTRKRRTWTLFFSIIELKNDYTQTLSIKSESKKMDLQQLSIYELDSVDKERVGINEFIYFCSSLTKRETEKQSDGPLSINFSKILYSPVGVRVRFLRFDLIKFWFDFFIFDFIIVYIKLDRFVFSTLIWFSSIFLNQFSVRIKI